MDRDASTKQLLTYSKHPENRCIKAHYNSVTISINPLISKAYNDALIYSFSSIDKCTIIDTSNNVYYVSPEPVSIAH